MNTTDYPLYKKIEDHIMELIKIRQLLPGDCLPAERELGKRFKASQIPVRQAIQSLIKKSVLERIPYKGTFVRQAITAPAKTNKIGLLYHFDDHSLFASSFYTAIVSGINAQAQKEERTLMFRSFRMGQNGNPPDAFRELYDDVDGFLLLDPSYELLTLIKPVIDSLHKPVVVLNYEGDLETVDQVVFDSYVNSKKMVEFLIGLGHTRIAFVQSGSSILFNEKTNPNFCHRQKAYRDVMAAHGRPAREIVLNSLADRAVWADFARQAAPPTAVFCFDDQIAMAVYRLAREHGITIPGQLTVAGFDGLKEAADMNPPLTTIGTPMAELGAVGVKMILEKQNHPDRVPQKIVLPGTLTIRQSHCRLK
jgi:DNA-binding LacI/PurR family transcriptional regulator